MGDTDNLGLDIAEESGRPRVARVYLTLACSYLKDGGAPTLTTDCTSYGELEAEITRLKDECDALLADAGKAFGAAAGPDGDVGSKPSASDATHSSEAAGAPDAPGKVPLRIEAGLRVEDRMTRDVKTMRRNDMLSVADELMKVGGFRHVVVLEDDDDTVVGVISHRDIFYGALAWSTGHGKTAHQRALEDVRVKNVMGSRLTTVAPDTPLVDAARIMLEENIGALPVIQNDRLVGILTDGDFLAMLTTARYGAPEP